jgi:uncharacterized protein
MSRENVEVVRRVAEAFTRGDMASVVGAVDPSIEWDLSRAATWPEQRVYRGFEAVLEFFGEWSGSWEDYRFEVEEIVDAGEKVLVVVRDEGRSRATGITLERRRGEVWTLRDGKVVRIDLFDNRAEAVEAAGLRE